MDARVEGSNMKPQILTLFLRAATKLCAWSELAEFIFDTEQSKKVAQSARQLLEQVELLVEQERRA